jgi:hypothetical protein
MKSETPHRGCLGFSLTAAGVIMVPSDWVAAVLVAPGSPGKYRSKGSTARASGDPAARSAERLTRGRRRSDAHPCRTVQHTQEELEGVF